MSVIAKLCWVTGSLEAIPGGSWHRVGDTIDRVSVVGVDIMPPTPAVQGKWASH